MDRLAASRAQRAGNADTIELGNIPGNGAAQNGDDMSGFYNEVGAVRDAIRSQLVPTVTRIGDLHSRTLNSTDEAALQRDKANLDAIMEETRKLTTELNKRIKALERQGGSEGLALVRRQQAAALKSEFKEAVENYQRVEQQYRQRYRERMERQFKIVKPDATPEEVQAVLEDGQGGQIFAQALRNTTRYGESRAAYREVQERHEEVQRIEKTLTELAQLFNDMSILVEEQEEGINVINTNAADANRDTEKAVQQVDKAVISAKRARRMRWICFFIILIILVIIAIVVAIEVTNNQKKS
ncbi:syntaxin-like protein [Calocera viscosa TUFC12733]|uniref:Syntaxin-like protein n=1 Tax=Calocera viscosa (strain TUFC12733) TaxID=1330018 RepID=A0A167NPD6_CALVF|nr:syntaxin-like protein [Calocera viscosa TUFC12733]